MNTSNGEINKITIKGNQPLYGTVSLSGDPISAMFNLVLGAMYQDKFTIKNVPRSNVVLTFLSIFQQIGFKVNWLTENSISVETSDLNNDLSSILLINDYDFYEHLLIPLMLKKTLECYIKSSSRDVIKFYRKLGFDVTVNLEENKCHIHVPQLLNIEKSFDVRESFGTMVASRLLLKEVIDEMHVIYNENDVRFQQLEYIKQQTKKNIEIVSSYNQVEFNLFSSIGALSDEEVVIENFDLSQSLQYLLTLNEFGVQYEVIEDSKLKLWKNNYSFQESYDYTNRSISEVAFLLIFFAKFLTKPTSVLIKHFDDLDEFVKSVNMVGGRVTYIGEGEYTLLQVKPADISPVKISVVDKSWNAMHILSGVVANGNTVLDNFASISNFVPNIIDNLRSLHVEVVT